MKILGICDILQWCHATKAMITLGSRDVCGMHMETSRKWGLQFISVTPCCKFIWTHLIQRNVAPQLLSICVIK